MIHKVNLDFFLSPFCHGLIVELLFTRSEKDFDHLRVQSSKLTFSESFPCWKNDQFTGLINFTFHFTRRQKCMVRGVRALWSQMTALEGHARTYIALPAKYWPHLRQIYLELIPDWKIPMENGKLKPSSISRPFVGFSVVGSKLTLNCCLLALQALPVYDW